MTRKCCLFGLRSSPKPRRPWVLDKENSWIKANRDNRERDSISQYSSSWELCSHIKHLSTAGPPTKSSTSVVSTRIGCIVYPLLSKPRPSVSILHVLQFYTLVSEKG